jgi:hypothetical protein
MKHNIFSALHSKLLGAEPLRSLPAGTDRPVITNMHIFFLCNHNAQQLFAPPTSPNFEDARSKE